PSAACHLAGLLHRALHALHDPLRNRRRHPRQLHWYLGGLLRHLHRHAHQLAHLTRLLRRSCGRTRCTRRRSRYTRRTRSATACSPSPHTFGTLKFGPRLENLVCELLIDALVLRSRLNNVLRGTQRLSFCYRHPRDERRLDRLRARIENCRQRIAPRRRERQGWLRNVTRRIRKALATGG